VVFVSFLEVVPCSPYICCIAKWKLSKRLSKSVSLFSILFIWMISCLFVLRRSSPSMSDIIVCMLVVMFVVSIATGSLIFLRYLSLIVLLDIYLDGDSMHIYFIIYSSFCCFPYFCLLSSIINKQLFRIVQPR